MKILQLIPSLVGGGAERQMAYVSTALARLGNEGHGPRVTIPDEHILRA
jgi:hypothetical protein